uniref:FlgD/Vpr Ig-like domain-containing protein n=1 Tax=uncultured bacterium W4-87b TaxID=1130995 RepID=H9BWU4_9BACT|nr:hypothetical protein [uncultured bacterium W4-87b]
MKASTSRILIALGLCFSLLGFYSFKKSSPEDLGFHRPKIDDLGLIELAVDQIRHEIKTGKLNSLSPALNLKTEQIQIEGERAIFQGKFAASENSLELTFERKNGQWELVESSGLRAELQHLNKDSNIGLVSTFEASGFEIYSEDGNSPQRTLIKRQLSPEHEIDKVTKSITLGKLDRQLFQKPYAGVLFSSVTQLSSAPFLTARYVQLVTDPAWNRIIYGDYEGWMKAYDGRGTGPEALNRPHGIDRDAIGNVYVADTGNDRIVVLRLEGTGEQTELKYQFSFGSDEMMHPYDVAWDGAGTPFDSSDDIIWVTDTGNHRILGFALDGEAATLRYNFGASGSAAGHFFEPKAIGIGRFNGLSTNSLYVGDTGNRRVVKLNILDNSLEWANAVTFKTESRITSLDVDHWGNLYVSDRSYRELRKLSSDLEPIVSVKGTEDSIIDPMNFHVTFGQVYVQAEDKRYWAGYDQAFTLEKWSETSGAERFQLGLDLINFKVKLSENLDQMHVFSKLTDHGKLSLFVIDEKTNATVRQIPLGWMVPGDKEISWDRRDDLGWQTRPGYYRLQLSAESSYGSLTTLKETPPFYLPLYYSDDSGSDIYHDAHLVQGVRSSAWGNSPLETIAKHPSEVIYRFTKLNPTAEYEIRAEFYNKAGTYLKQRITADGSLITPDFELPAGQMEVDWSALPRETYSDGEIELKISKSAGDGDAMISRLWLREANYDPANPPASLENEVQIPEEYTLSQNFPNPFNPSTTIEFGVPGETFEDVTLKVFNVLGQTVRELVNGQLPPGRHSVTWNGKDNLGLQVSSGLYFYQLNAGEFVAIKKLILMK